MDERIKKLEGKMQKAYDFLLSDFATIRAGRANPHVLDKIRVDYYGTPTPIQQVGNISVPEARMIQIAPWEKNLLKAIEKAIQTSDLGINPTNDGSVIRLVFPELTEERRRDLVKEIKKKGKRARSQSAISAVTGMIPLRNLPKQKFPRTRSNSLKRSCRS